MHDRQLIINRKTREWYVTHCTLMYESRVHTPHLFNFDRVHTPHLFNFESGFSQIDQISGLVCKCEFTAAQTRCTWECFV